VVSNLFRFASHFQDFEIKNALLALAKKIRNAKGKGVIVA
jgi:hypothetical protein